MDMKMLVPVKLPLLTKPLSIPKENNAGIRLLKKMWRLYCYHYDLEGLDLKHVGVAPGRPLFINMCTYIRVSHAIEYNLYLCIHSLAAHIKLILILPS